MSLVVSAARAQGPELLVVHERGAAKRVPLDEYPRKGRATGGVRSQTMGRGEVGLALAWAGPAPALAVARDGAPRRFPEALARRDAPGIPLEAVIDAFGTAAR